MGGEGIACTLLLLGVAWPATAIAAEPSKWSDSERPEDLVYFDVFGGVSFASASRLLHQSDEGGVSEAADVSAPPSFDAGFGVTFWPYDFFAVAVSTDVFGFPMQVDTPRYDACSGCRLERSAPYDGFGFDWSVTAKTGLPLRYFEPMIGAGLVLPVDVMFTVDPRTRLDTTALEAGLALRATGGLAFFVAREVRLYADYRLDYRALAINAREPVELEELLRHSVVAGVLYTPDSYQESPTGDRAGQLFVPIGLPALAVLGTMVARAALGPEDR